MATRAFFSALLLLGVLSAAAVTSASADSADYKSLSSEAEVAAHVDVDVPVVEGATPVTKSDASSPNTISERRAHVYILEDGQLADDCPPTCKNGCFCECHTYQPRCFCCSLYCCPEPGKEKAETIL